MGQFVMTTIQKYKQQLMALMPRGSFWDGIHKSDRYNAVLESSSDEFVTVETSSTQLIDESFPDSTSYMLEKWEEAVKRDDDDYLLGIDRTTLDRQTLVTSKVNDIGFDYISYLKQRAAEIGHDIEIEEIDLSTSGWLTVGDVISIEDTNRFYIQINVPIESTFGFIAGSSEIGEVLGYWQPTRLEKLLERIKPAHIAISWNYELE